MILTSLFMIDPSKPPVTLLAKFLTAFIPAEAKFLPSFSYHSPLLWTSASHFDG